MFHLRALYFILTRPPTSSWVMGHMGNGSWVMGLRGMDYNRSRVFNDYLSGQDLETCGWIDALLYKIVSIIFYINSMHL